ncbi:hypothetical protein F4803DRAFT_574490 [Xylaria telfairii]|nr:hypothetical protein F4803DRAFT_574490 [Xylaria telfairii]
MQVSIEPRLGNASSALAPPSRFLTLEHVNYYPTASLDGRITLTAFLIPRKDDSIGGRGINTFHRNFRWQYFTVWFWVLTEDDWVEKSFGKLEQKRQDEEHSRTVICEFRLWPRSYDVTPEHEESSARDPLARESWAQALAKVMPPVTAWKRERWAIWGVPRFYPPEEVDPEDLVEDLIDGGPSTAFIDPATVPSSSSSGLPISTTYFTPIAVPITVPSATATTVTFPASTRAITIRCPATTSIVFATPPVAVATTCTNSADLILDFACPTTRILTFLGPVTAVATVDCSLVTTWKTGSTSTTTPLPVFTTWPAYGQIMPEEEEIDEPEPDDTGVRVPCTVWFFFFCISWGNTHLRS